MVLRCCTGAVYPTILPAPKKIYVRIFFGAAPVQHILPSYLHHQKYMSRFFSVHYRCSSSYHLIFECLGMGHLVLHRCSLSYHPTCTLKNISPDFGPAPVQVILPPNFRMSWDWTFGAAPVQPILPSYLHRKKYMSGFFSVQHRCSTSYHPTCTLKNICPDFFRCSTGAGHPTT